jgi:hypothetical protein
MGNQRKETSGESTPKFVESMALSKCLVRMLPAETSSMEKYVGTRFESPIPFSN